MRRREVFRSALTAISRVVACGSHQPTVPVSFDPLPMVASLSTLTFRSTLPQKPATSANISPGDTGMRHRPFHYLRYTTRIYNSSTTPPPSGVPILINGQTLEHVPIDGMRTVTELLFAMKMLVPSLNRFSILDFVVRLMPQDKPVTLADELRPVIEELKAYEHSYLCLTSPKPVNVLFPSEDELISARVCSDADICYLGKDFLVKVSDPTKIITRSRDVEAGQEYAPFIAAYFSLVQKNKSL